MVDHPGLVHLDFRGCSALRRVPHASSYGVVVEAEVVFTAVDWERSRTSLVRVIATPGVHVGSANHPSGSQGLGLVTVGVAF